MLRALQAVDQQQDEEFLDDGEHDERDHRTEAEAEAGPVDEPEEDQMTLLPGTVVDAPAEDDMSEERLLRALMEAQGED